ncbi:PLP-dependent aminotransferase family protein [Actinomadura craniellae]|uniref:PLP-dependent aminotransferase family protein n=1 Tax=Actinomadura craniellae TaxID=2231787 RepID=A0A365H3S2_9ACTN|nr:PLP-dependent aminotransferase family protein [Actinomadura craniellae]RAY13699.1 PLP-dependent aminotransferase family protein [Actinomadura craniellae]
MPIEWAGSSPGLLLPLDRASSEPLRSQLERGLREAIRHGRLQAGERLPSSREMARELGVSRGLVQECYSQLHAEGYLTARVGSATRVAELATRGAPAATAPPPVPAPRPLVADFATGVPHLAGFPRGDWLWAQREVGRHAPTAAFGYGDPRGSLTFRRILAGYLGRVRAAAAEPDRIVACTGFAQGLSLVLRVLVRAGLRRVAFEDPGYGEGATMAAAAWAGVDAVPVPVDRDGIDVDALAATGARAVLLTPAHQWPTGVVLAPGRRHELIAWAARCDGVLIEDDYDAEFRYDREPVGTLQGLAPDRVVALGTVSKSLAPALRLGWVLCPPALADALITEKRFSDRGSPLLDQLALAALIESGRYDRHLRRMRAGYAGRRAALVDALALHAPHVELTGLAAGFHAVAHLPGDADERAVVAAARARSVGLYGMSDYRFSRAATPPQLVLGFGNLSERAIADGIAAIADLL